MEKLKVILSLLAIFALSCISHAQNINMQAPAWVNPNKPDHSINEGGYDVYTVSTQNPIFQWTPPVVSAAPSATYAYDLRIVELVEGQPVDYLMANAPIFFKKNGLIVPQFIIPANVIKLFLPNHLYAVQVTAKQRTTALPFGSNSAAIPPIPGPIMVFQVQAP
ncbi:MAG: hypothetical protein ACI4AH_03890 [Muribaculaceae bacterium]